MDSNHPYFLWDYDLTETDVYRILKSGNEFDKRWLLGRILSSARFDDVWKYVTLKEVVKEFPYLKLRPPIYQAWKRALEVWGYPTDFPEAPPPFSLLLRKTVVS